MARAIFLRASNKAEIEIVMAEIGMDEIEMATAASQGKYMHMAKMGTARMRRM